jgi:hypothetical protein
VFYLGPPVDIKTVDAAFLFSFNNNSENGFDDFYGYEVYYKFYLENDTQIDSDIADIDASASAGTYQLQNRNFRRIVSSSTPNQKPLIPVESVNKGLSFDINIDFKGPFAPTSEPTAEWNSKTVVLKRSVIEGGIPGSYKTFLETGIDAADEDIPDSYTGTESLILVLYGISYGIDGSNFNEIYSIPKHLGSITITF